MVWDSPVVELVFPLSPPDSESVYSSIDTYVCVSYSEGANLWIGVAFIGFMPETPYLVHHNSETPHVTCCCVLLEIQGLIRKGQSCILSHFINSALLYITSGGLHRIGIFPPREM